jgi:predicted flap endonuclease-1-like 5' DNA nuclease
VSYKITEIEGIGPVRAETLATAGIATTDDLLDQCADAKGREAVAEKTGISTVQLLKWANMADLMRISGVGSEYSELLEAAGVDTVKELKHRRPDNLTAKMAEVNAEKKLVRSVPSEAAVTKWVEQAKTMEPRISH